MTNLEQIKTEARRDMDLHGQFCAEDRAYLGDDPRCCRSWEVVSSLLARAYEAGVRSGLDENEMVPIAYNTSTGGEYVVAERINGGLVKVATERSYPQTYLVYEDSVKFLNEERYQERPPRSGCVHHAAEYMKKCPVACTRFCHEAPSSPSTQDTNDND